VTSFQSSVTGSVTIAPFAGETSNGAAGVDGGGGGGGGGGGAAEGLTVIAENWKALSSAADS
jgi:hypothetical protein